MTTEDLNREKKIFIIGFIIAIAVVIGLSKFTHGIIEVIPGAAENAELTRTLNTILLLISFGAKGFYVYLVYRLSRFLGQPLWMTLVYCILAPFSVLYLIPLIALLIGVKNAREKLSAPLMSEK